MSYCANTWKNVETQLDDTLRINTVDMEVLIFIDNALYDLPVKNGKGHLGNELRLLVVPRLLVIDCL